MANLLSEICPCVAVELDLQPLSGEEFHLRSTIKEDHAQLGVSANEFWDKSKTAAHFDVKVFNVHASSNHLISAASCYRKHELKKRRKYERRIIAVEHGTFTPFVMSTNGGMGPSATVTVKQLAALLAEKMDTPYSKILNVIRCRLTFSLLDSAIMCIRGARSSSRRPDFKISQESPELIAGVIS